MIIRFVDRDTKHKKNIAILILAMPALMFVLYYLSYQFFFVPPIIPHSIITSIYEPTEKYISYFMLEDSNVFAIQNGEVTYVGLDETKKKYKIVIKHSFGYTSEYRNLLSETILVSVGQKVKIGQIIANIRISIKMSNLNRTKTYSNNVLNFIIRRHSIPVEPKNHLKLKS